MAEDRRKEIVRHLSEDDLDRLLAETDDDKISKRLTFVKRLYKGATLEDAATTSAGPLGRLLAGYDAGTKAVSGSSRRTSGAAGPRSSARRNENNCLNSCERVSPGKHRRYSIFSTKNSTSSTIRTILLNF